MKKKHYEKNVYEKVQIEAFQYLKNKIKSKRSAIDYGIRIVMQSYLKPNNGLKFQDQLEIFSYRSEINQLNSNFKGLQEDENMCLYQNIEQPTFIPV